MEEQHQVKPESEDALNASTAIEHMPQIKDIVLEKELASGLLAKVYKGHQTLLQRTVAMKILSKNAQEFSNPGEWFTCEQIIHINLIKC